MNSSARFLLAGAVFAVSSLLFTACSRSPESGRSVPVAARRQPVVNATARVARPNDLRMRGVHDIPDPRLRLSEFMRLLRDWTAEDPEAALEFVRQLPPGAEHTAGVLLVLDALGRIEPERALAVARDLASNRDERAFYNSLFAQLAATDPAAAVARLPLVPRGDARERAVRALSDTWAAADVVAALAWAQDLDPVDRPLAMEAVLMAMAPNDPRRAIDLARENLTGPALDRTLITAIGALALRDPRAAATIVISLPPGETQAMVAFDVARALAARAPGEALAWMQTLPAGPMQRSVLNNILEVWATQDAAAAGQYVAQLPAGPGCRGETCVASAGRRRSD